MIIRLIHYYIYSKFVIEDINALAADTLIDGTDGKKYDFILSKENLE